MKRGGIAMTEPFSSYLARLVIALVIGGAIGLEREFKGKPAGMRTNMLICVGSCLIMIISIEIARTAVRTSDPGRIAAQVITGIGFLGAGTIIRSRFHIVGLTTAATIWALSAIGLAVGAGYIVLAIAAALLITITLVFIGYIEERLETKRSYHVIQVTLERGEGIIRAVMALFSSMKVSSEALEVIRSGELWRATFEYASSQEKHRELVEKLSESSGVKGVMEL
jgi:putative Mg2+ transporter-C (MgtC) family protein